MLLTIRHRILAEMAAALASLTVPKADGAGVIVLEVDSAAAQQASGSPEWVQVISNAVKAGKIAVEIDAGPDVYHDGSQGGESRSMLDRWKFDVVLACHLPDTLPEDGDPAKVISPERMADLVCAEIYRLCGTLFPSEGISPAQCGRWLNAVTKQEGEPDGMPLAIRTDVLQKGSVGLSSYAGTRVTLFVMEVHYRTRAGRPEVPQ